MSLIPGTRLGPYEIQSAIGAGGMGEVYKALDTRLDRTVAIKTISPTVAGDPERRARFEREAKTIAALNHAHVCALYDVGHQDGTDFLVMEYIDGETVAVRARRGVLPIEEIEQIGIQLAEGLGAAHEHGLVHRDIKPSNLMLSSDGTLKILDFGLAKQREPPRDQETTKLACDRWSTTLPGVLVGTPGYMAPEYITGDPAGPSSDVYAAGCVLYELISGCAPFRGTDTADFLRRILADTPRPLSECRPETPTALAAVVMRAMARNPATRYANGRELAAALRAASASQPVVAVRERTVPRRIGRLAASVVLIGACCVLAWNVVSRLTTTGLAFKERDFVVIGDVTNGTGETVFDFALKSALETDLRQSRYVNVVDAAQIANALRMMRQKPGVRLSPDVGREVCRRIGAKALLVPSIVRAGNAYQLDVGLMDPATARLAAEVKVTARGREQVLLSSIDTLTRQLRDHLGESLASIARTDPPFAQYTTSSLEALDLLTLGQRSWGLGDFAKAERSFGEALKRDPRFAMARGSLGLLLIQFLNRPEEGRKLLDQALREEGTVSEREYLHLRAVHKQFVGSDLQGALDDYRFIIDLYPDQMPAYNNSGRILQQLGRYRDAASMFERAHRLDPRSLVPLWNLWFLSIRQMKDPDVAERTARMLLDLSPGTAEAEHALAWSLVTQRRFAQAEQAMRAVLKIDGNHRFALPNLAHLLFRRGAFDEAIATYRDVLGKAAEGHLQTGVEHLTVCLGVALAASGRSADARRVMSEGARKMRARIPDATMSAEDRAILAALVGSAGRRDEARSLLRRAAAAAHNDAAANLWLARTWAVLGDPSQATRYLERAFAAGYTDTYMIVLDPLFASLQDDPAIERLAPRRAVAGVATKGLSGKLASDLLVGV